jgi:hypothetical protein
VDGSVFPCEIKASISWRSSSEGKLETLDTRVNSTCL